MSDFSNEEDQRRTFRISEPAWVEFVLIDNVSDQQKEQPIEQLFDNAENFKLITEVNMLDMEFETLFSTRNDLDPNLTGLFKLLNRKINAATSLMTSQQQGAIHQSVSLSEEGVGFFNKDPIPEDKVVAIRLQLSKENIGLVLKARVVYHIECKTEEYNQPSDLNYRIGCQLIDVDEQKRQLIRRHILAFQAHQKRAQQ